MKHIFAVEWLSDDLVGFKCVRCGHECVEPDTTKCTYWYKFEEWICVLCGKEDIYKTRVYGKPKPENYYERHIEHDTACESHFI